MTKTTATAGEIAATYDLLQTEHSRHLLRSGVVLPNLKTAKGTYNCRALQLILLRMNLEELVSREDVSAFVRAWAPNAAADQQSRHLKYAGWDVRLGGKAQDLWLDGTPVPNGYNGLANVLTPHADFGKAPSKRRARLAPGAWAELLDVYQHRCAVCHEEALLLEKGHKDPSLGDSIGNLIPMCGKCNNWASNNVVLGDDGRVVALANEKLVDRSTEAVQFEIFRFLKRKFK